MSDGAAERRLRDLVRLHLDGRRVLGAAAEKALLERALDLPGVTLAAARAVLLDRALASGVLLENRERERVADVIRERARGGRIDRRTVRAAALLARPLLRARGEGEDATAFVVALAEREGLRACTGLVLPGPWHWSTAMGRFRALRAWQAVR